MSWTTRFRVVFVTLLSLAVLVALGGWLVYDRDPEKLTSVIGWLTGVVGIGEGSNVGKRLSFKPEAVGLPEAQS